ncbi:hypothetical protein AB0M43_10275 [Longispora sp. NPDC051575]|uniref:hypothetical protein n=1 Tax=Longispora sp. NPDC051575 TaxID=3154943 RepID=UPI00344213A2
MMAGTPRRHRWAGRVLAAVLLAVAALVTTTIGAPPAQAAGCNTPGHAYLIHQGRVYFSGYEGDERFGVPTLTVARGSWVQLAGNGVRPGTQAVFVDALGFNYTTTAAGSNCVIRQESNPWRINPDIAPGTYLVDASYLTPTRQVLHDRVVYLQVV